MDSFTREPASDDFVVMLATNGVEAVELIKANRFDVVVTALLMPGRDGVQILEAAKQRDRQTVVIVLTGYGDLGSVADALRRGADDFLQKPCDPGELLCRISNGLARRERQRKMVWYATMLHGCRPCVSLGDDARQEERGRGPWRTLEEFFGHASGVPASLGCSPDGFDGQRPQ